MPAGFRNVHLHREEPASLGGLEGLTRFEGFAAPGEETPTGRALFSNDESAARYYMGQVLGASPLESISQLTAPDRPGLVPDLRLQKVRERTLTNTRTLHFQQTKASIPIFGSSAVVELGPDRQLVSIDVEVGEPGEVSPIAQQSPAQALESIAQAAQVPVARINLKAAPELNFFYSEEDGAWHLAYFFQKVPAAPVEFLREINSPEYEGHGLTNHFGPDDIEINYLVDAHDGNILFFYSANPTLVTPSKCLGIDEDGRQKKFWGHSITSGFEMYDPRRGIRTFDLTFQDRSTKQLPGDPVNHTAADWASTNPAAVAAHANATHVYDFYKSEMKRDSIDDKGMELISYINCTDSGGQTPPEWFNAVWSKECMWYGQKRDGNGILRSFARYLDVIAHELTHGVTAHTAALVYSNLSGALNESLSDIFGILIKNWSYQGGYLPVASWDWELGSGLGKNGQVLRNLCDPASLGYPDHMKDQYIGFFDSGGVHINSNIHNKAAYNVLTAMDANLQYIFPPDEVANLYYETLNDLPSQADFSKARQMLISKAQTFYAGNPIELNLKVQAIKDAYDAVGIY